MPYRQFSQLSDEDLASIIVYVRSLPPLRHALPKSEIPQAVLARHEAIAAAATQFFGGSLDATEARSLPGRRRGVHILPHTTPERGRSAGDVLRRRHAVPRSLGNVASANLTPDPSGIPYYDERMFLEVMRTGWNDARKINPVMPWPYFRGMTTDDLRAIFAFLRTIAPVKHRVDNAEKLSPCRKCGYVHGLGEMN